MPSYKSFDEFQKDIEKKMQTGRTASSPGVKDKLLQRIKSRRKQPRA